VLVGGVAVFAQRTESEKTAAPVMSTSMQDKAADDPTDADDPVDADEPADTTGTWVVTHTTQTTELLNAVFEPSDTDFADEMDASSSDGVAADTAADAASTDDALDATLEAGPGATEDVTSTGSNTISTTCDITLDARGNMIARDTIDGDARLHETWERDEDGYATAWHMDESVISADAAADTDGDTTATPGSTTTTYTLEKDEAGRLVRSEASDGTTLSYTYAASGALATRTVHGTYTDRDMDDNPVERGYDVETSFLEDGLIERQVTTTEGLAELIGAQTTSYTYVRDADGHPSSATRTTGSIALDAEDGSSDSAAGATDAMAEDGSADDTPSSAVDDEQASDATSSATGDRILFSYDASGNLAQMVVEADGMRVTTTYTWVLIADPSPAVLTFAHLVEP
jgi:YD repeat-containing protein